MCKLTENHLIETHFSYGTREDMKVNGEERMILLAHLLCSLQGSKRTPWTRALYCTGGGRRCSEGLTCAAHTLAVPGVRCWAVWPAQGPGGVPGPAERVDGMDELAPLQEAVTSQT